VTVYVNIPDARLVRICKCLSLLASDKPGERLAAADAALRLLKQYGLTWEGVILNRWAERPKRTRIEPLKEKIQLLRDNFNLLSKWERLFVISIPGFSRLSTKQLAVIDRLADKVRNQARAA
jgi:hypothetical protein